MMEELTHPVELSDEELELVAAGGGECRAPVLEIEIEAEVTVKL